MKYLARGHIVVNNNRTRIWPREPDARPSVCKHCAMMLLTS